MKIQAYNSNIITKSSFKGRDTQDAVFVLLNTASQNSLTPLRQTSASDKENDLFSVLGKTFKTLVSPEITKRSKQINKNLDAIVNASFDTGHKLDYQV